MVRHGDVDARVRRNAHPHRSVPQTISKERRAAAPSGALRGGRRLHHASAPRPLCGYRRVFGGGYRQGVRLRKRHRSRGGAGHRDRGDASPCGGRRVPRGGDDRARPSEQALQVRSLDGALRPLFSPHLSSRKGRRRSAQADREVEDQGRHLRPRNFGRREARCGAGLGGHGQGTRSTRRAPIFSSFPIRGGRGCIAT